MISDATAPPNTASRLRDWFRIEPAERPIFLVLAASTFFVTAANILLFDLLQAFLIKRAGVSLLPYFYIGSSVAIFIGSWIALNPLRYWKPVKQGSWYAGAAFIGAMLLALTQHFFSSGSGLPRLLLFVFFGLLINSAAIIGVVTKLVIIMTDAFSVEQQQRLEPLLTSVSTISALSAGFLLGALSPHVSSTFLFSLVALLLAVVVLCFQRLRRLARAVSAPLPEPGPSEKTGGGLLQWGLPRDFQETRLRRFLYLLGGIVALSMVFTRLFNFQFAAAADIRFTTEADLNAFFGWYTVVVSLGTIIFINTLRRALLRRHGLTRNLFLPPLAVMAGVLGILAWPVFAVVVAVVYLREVILSLQHFTVHALLGGISDYQRKLALAWLEGPATTAGSLFGSGLIIAVTYLFSGTGMASVIRVLAAIALFFLIVRIVITGKVRRRYPAVIMDSLQHGDFKTRLRAIEAMAELGFMPDRQLGALLDTLRRENEPVALRLAALRTLAAIKDPSTLRVVCRLLDHPDPSLRLETVRAVAAFQYRSDRLFESGFSRQSLIEKLRRLFAEERTPEIINAVLTALMALRDPDIVTLLAASLKKDAPKLQHSALHSLRQFRDPAIIDHVKPFLAHANADLRAQAVAAIWRFPWERNAYLKKNIDGLLASPAGSEERRQGLYLIGALRLSRRRATLHDALRAADPGSRSTAAIALLKLGDESGISVIEEVMRYGTAGEAGEVVRLAHHRNVPVRQQLRIQALIHEHHLHYPEDLPVSEPLRVRLRDIPKDCLAALLEYYAPRSETADDRRKIERALRHENFPSVRGRAVLVGLSGPWRAMAGVCLLAHGFLVRRAEPGDMTHSDELVIGNADDPRLPAGAFVLSDLAEGLTERQIAAKHYAPSELIAAIRNSRPELFG